MTTPAAGSSAAAGGRASLDELARGLIALYTNAEARLLDEAARGVSGTRAQVEMLADLRRAAQRVVNALALRSDDLVRQVTDRAAHDGDAAALAMLRRMVEGDPRLAARYLSRVDDVSGHAAAAAVQVRVELGLELRSTWSGILRFADDAYRAAVADATTALVGAAHGLTPNTAQQIAWRSLTRQGITGFRDRAGRQWNLASYVEMAVRTATNRAQNAAAQARYAAEGIRYFTIPHDGHPCPLCRPWEGAVLSLDRVGTVAEANAATGAPVAFTVKATVEQARAAGLWHPNCRHPLSPYLPGVTKTRPPAAWSKADQAAYDATQQLRYLERQVRAAKRERDAAPDAAAKRAAARRVRAYQARIKDHVERHGLVRRPRREQLDLGNR